ncbi:MAG: site-specific DNA-methyltransferase [Verrucomicrobiales bacterium]|nr:site-specific DNA-methyltransferase [Verrucomicrobiales bacterium]
MPPKTAPTLEPIDLPFDEAMDALLDAPKEKEVVPFPVQKDSKISPWLGKIHFGDCIGIMNQIPEESVDLVVTSPPYNIKNSSGNGLKNGSGGKWENAALIKGYNVHDDNMPHEKYVEWQRDCLRAMMRVLKNDGAIFYNHKWRVQNGLLQDRSDILEGFPVRQIIIWKRKGGINFNPGYFLPTYEVIYVITKPDFKLAKGANKMGDVWEIPQTRGIDHPAPFPVELAQRCCEASDGPIVLDPFMGSGSTAIAASMLGKQWIGIDISLDYCELAKSRIEEHSYKAKIQKHE